MTKYFRILWDGYADLIPTSKVRKVGTQSTLTHEVQGPLGGRKNNLARCDLKVSKESAIFDYVPHTSFNKSKGWDIGIMKLEFSDNRHEQIKAVLWRYPKESRFSGYDADASILEIAETKLGDFDVDIGPEREGDRKLVSHLRAERSSKLVRAKKNSASSLRCAACKFDFEKRYGDLGKAYCEVHHQALVSEKPRLTHLDDLAIVCSNCHRMIHRRSPMLTIDELKKLLR